MRHHRLQRFYLERLGRLAELDDYLADARASSRSGLVERALYSTYRDCERVGLEVVAQAVLADMCRFRRLGIGCEPESLVFKLGAPS